MKGARYIIRVDDITDTINWGRFERLMELLNRHGAKPLLGVVPRNEDPRLCCGPPNARFWEIMRELHREGKAEFAQHGYTHVLTPACRSHQGHHQRRSDRTEFFGIPFEEQLRRILAGREILSSEGIHTTWWVAPRHSSDADTLKALRIAGFTAVSDGISLFPFEGEGLIFVPQQFWRSKWARWVPFGTATICLHPGTITESDFMTLDRFLSGSPKLTSFSDEVARYKASPLRSVLNALFRVSYAASCPLREVVRYLLVLSGIRAPQVPAASPAGK